MVRTQVNAAYEIDGILPVVNGGTGYSSLTSAGIEQTANKNAASGYCGLNSSGYVAAGQLGSGSASSSTVLNGASAWEALTRAIVPENVTDSASTSLTLTTSSSTWVFTGSSVAIWTLPAVSGNTGVLLIIENRGSAAVGLVPAGSDHIWFGSAVIVMTIAAGASLNLVNDGSYWNALSTDLANNSIGILPVANGGTGQTSLTSLPLTTPVLTGYSETVQALGTIGSTKTLPAVASGTIMWGTLTSATACTFTMPTAAAGASFFLALRQPASGTATTSTFTGVKWPAAGAPVITATVGRADVFSFICYDGTNWYGSYVQGYTY
jgi:hypothetical protein